MKLKNLIIIAMAVSSLAITPAHAGKDARNGSKDARIKTFNYYENEVYQIRAHYGFSTLVEFSGKEKVETIAVGDSEAWQIIRPKGRPNILLIKPLEDNAETNLSVITNKRIYSFEMSAKKAHSHKSRDLAFKIKFLYPTQTDLELANIGNISKTEYNPISEISGEDLNLEYSYSGSKRLRPNKVFDDGEFTYFQFKGYDVLPAIFSVDEKGSESLVNYNIQGKYLVVNKIGRQFTLRDGDTATCIFNDSFPHLNLGIEKTKTPISKIKQKQIVSSIPTPLEKPTTGNIETANLDGTMIGRLFAKLNVEQPEEMNN